MKNIKVRSVASLLFMVIGHASISSQHQIEIDSVIGVGRDAIQIKFAQSNGVEVNSSGGHGIHVFEAGGAGVYVGNVANGVEVNQAGNNGVLVTSAEANGLHVSSADLNGVSINNAGDDGVYISSVGGYGLYVHDAFRHSMNIQGSKSASTLAGHIGLIKNRSTTTNADVLALQVGTTGNPGPGNNFISFYNGSANSVGRIEGNGSGGILFGTSGGDFAECLPRLDPLDVFQPGDVVGVLDGRISHSTVTANQLMVITDRPAVLGNQPENDENYEKVSFIGQVPVRVRGEVQAGDWIVASGLEDGTGIAVPPSQNTLDHQIVGRAWESSEEPDIKRVNMVVGLDQSVAKDVIIRNIQAEVFRLKREMTTQQVINRSLQEQVDALNKLISISKSSTIQP